jgi:hypothetical protein
LATYTGAGNAQQNQYLVQGTQPGDYVAITNPDGTVNTKNEREALAIGAGYNPNDPKQYEAYLNGGLQGLANLALASGNKALADKYDAARDQLLYGFASGGNSYIWNQNVTDTGSSLYGTPVSLMAQQTTGGAINSNEQTAQLFANLLRRTDGTLISNYGAIDTANALLPNKTNEMSAGSGIGDYGTGTLSSQSLLEAKRLGIPDSELNAWSEDDIHAAYLDPKMYEYLSTSKKLFWNGANVSGQQLEKDSKLAFLLANDLGGTTKGVTPYQSGKVDWISNPYEDGLGYNLAQWITNGPGGKANTTVGMSYLEGPRGIDYSPGDIAYMNRQFAKHGGVPIEPDANKITYGSDSAKALIEMLGLSSVPVGSRTGAPNDTSRILGGLQDIPGYCPDGTGGGYVFNADGSGYYYYGDTADYSGGGTYSGSGGSGSSGGTVTGGGSSYAGGSGGTVTNNSSNSGRPTYDGSADRQIQQILQELLMQEPYSYLYYNDPNWLATNREYDRNAQIAGEAALARVAGANGGYTTSNGQSIAAGTRQAYAGQALQQIPEFYSQDRATYETNRATKLAAADIAAILAGQNMNLYQLGNSYYENDRNFDYGAYRDTVADSQWNQMFDYNAYRDSVGDSQWQQSFDYNASQDSADRAYQQQLFAYQQQQDAAAAQLAQYQAQLDYEVQMGKLTQQQAELEYKYAQQQFENELAMQKYYLDALETEYAINKPYSSSGGSGSSGSSGTTNLGTAFFAEMKASGAPGTYLISKYGNLTQAEYNAIMKDYEAWNGAKTSGTGDGYNAEDAYGTAVFNTIKEILDAKGASAAVDRLDALAKSGIITTQDAATMKYLLGI